MATGAATGAGSFSLTEIVRAIFGAGWVWKRGFHVTGASDDHHGVDFSVAPGTPVPSLTSGTVVYAENAGGGGGMYSGPYVPADNLARAKAFWINGGGNSVIVEDANGVRYSYAHLSKFGVKVGDHVNVGSFIGNSGSTGDSTGPHLHFGMYATKLQRPSTYADQVRVPTEWIDPQPFLATLAASKPSTALLGAWNNIVAFPVGHKLTAADVDTIISRLDAAHFFQSSSNLPIFQQLGENQARDKTREILSQHIGEEWSGTLEQTLQGQLFGAATDAAKGLAFDIAKIFDPMTYIRVGALIIGLGLAFTGFRWMAQTGNGTGNAVG